MGFRIDLTAVNGVGEGHFSTKYNQDSERRPSYDPSQCIPSRVASRGDWSITSKRPRLVVGDRIEYIEAKNRY